VLGASSGIGRACSRAFARQGATVVVVARGQERLAAARQECVDEGAAAALALPADVLDQDRLHEVVGIVTSTYGRIDVVVHSAERDGLRQARARPPAVFERTVATAVHGTANLARAVLPTLRDQVSGTLVIVTSLLASVPVPWRGRTSPASGAKRGLRVSKGEQRDVPGVHVCTLAPGSVDTPIFRHAANFAGRRWRPPPPVASADTFARAIAAGRQTEKAPVRRSGELVHGTRVPAPPPRL
jgi:NAD(P)-dependent dehydrogenase (short-subunit alcohol dehydrogenase family)